MEFGKEDNQYSDTREEEEEEEEEQEEEEEEQDEELLQDQFNNNKVINATTTYHHHHQQQLPLLSSSLGSPSSSSSVTKKWINNISTPTTTRESDHHHHQGGAEYYLSDMNRMSWAGEREHMFDKVVTPSDVGKLNRLVIPKQHAEKYFPLDPNSTDKGLLLNFEDRSGKSWRFRYSYWNSSQSYVMTKGWSRFVKEKKLDAGDIVSFHRSGGGSSLFIDWRRRPNHHYPNADHHLHHHPYYQQYHHQRWGYSLPQSPAVPPAAASHESFHRRDYMASNNSSNNYYFYGHHLGVVRPANQASPPILFESVPVAVAAPAPAQPKRLRLFGVNMEYCPSQEDPNDHYRYRHQISESNSSVQLYPHHHQVRLPNNNIPSPLFPLLPTTATTTTTATSGSSFPEFSHKGKSSANSLSFDLDP